MTKYFVSWHVLSDVKSKSGFGSAIVTFPREIKTGDDFDELKLHINREISFELCESVSCVILSLTKL